MVKIIGVRFRSAGKVYYFDVKEFELHIGDHVIVETARGPEFGVVSMRARTVADDMVAQPLRSVIRVATKEDEEKRAELSAKEKEALKICREKIHKHNLEMKLVDAEYAFDENRILFYFTADGTRPGCLAASGAADASCAVQPISMTLRRFRSRWRKSRICL